MPPPNPALADICAAVRAIPAGTVSTYGAIAARAGWPGRARLVARALASSDETDLPWYRVVRADGRIALPEGSPGYREQSRRLRAEGVRVVAGRIDLRRFASSTDTSLDELLWAKHGAPG